MRSKCQHGQYCLGEFLEHGGKNHRALTLLPTLPLYTLFESALSLVGFRISCRNGKCKEKINKLSKKGFALIDSYEERDYFHPTSINPVDVFLMAEVDLEVPCK